MAWPGWNSATEEPGVEVLYHAWPARLCVAAPQDVAGSDAYGFATGCRGCSRSDARGSRERRFITLVPTGGGCTAAQPRRVKRLALPLAGAARRLGPA